MELLQTGNSTAKRKNANAHWRPQRSAARTAARSARTHPRSDVSKRVPSSAPRARLELAPGRTNATSLGSNSLASRTHSPAYRRHPDAWDKSSNATGRTPIRCAGTDALPEAPVGAPERTHVRTERTRTRPDGTQ